MSSATTLAAVFARAPGLDQRAHRLDRGGVERRRAGAPPMTSTISPARVLGRVARGELGRAPAHDLLVQLGQLTADGDGTIGVECGEHGQGRSYPPWRLERHDRLGRGEDVAQRRPACAAGSRRSARRRTAARSPPARSAPTTARAAPRPPAPRPRSPAPAGTRGRYTSGMPASLTSATTSPAQHPLDQLGRPRPLVVLVVARPATRRRRSARAARACGACPRRPRRRPRAARRARAA